MRDSSGRLLPNCGHRFSPQPEAFTIAARFNPRRLAGVLCQNLGEGLQHLLVHQAVGGKHIVAQQIEGRSPHVA